MDETAEGKAAGVGHPGAPGDAGGPAIRSVRRFRHARRVLAGSMFVMGACGIIYEYALGALGNYLIGSSHEQIFVVIGLMLFAMGLGAALQRGIAGELLDKFLLSELALGFLGGVSGLAIYAAYAYMAAYVLVLYAFAAAIGLLIGLEIPLLIRINREYSESLRTNLAEILCMDYVGALAGALLFTYVLLASLSIDRIALVLGLANVAIAAAGLAYFWPLVRRRRSLATGVLAVLAVLTLVLAGSGPWMTLLEQRCYRDPIVYSATGTYQHVVLTKRGQHVSLFLNGHLQFSSRDEAIYHEFLVHVPLMAASRRERVLILGGGDGLALREVLRYGDVRQVTLVDIDPLITGLASSHPELIRLNGNAFGDARVRRVEAAGVSPGDETPVERESKPAGRPGPPAVHESARVRVVNVDADVFLRSAGEEACDAAILDFPDPSTVELAKLYSVDFYRALAAHLRPGATVAVQSSSPYHAREVFLCIGRSLRDAGFRVLPYHENVPSFGEWGWHLAWLEGGTEDQMRASLASRGRLDVETRYLTSDRVGAAFAFGRGWLDGGEIRPNTKLRPAILDYYRAAWKNG